MKVVHVVDYFMPGLGYQEEELAFAMAELGHDVEVFTSDRHFPFPQYEQNYAAVLGPRKPGSGDSVEERNGISIRVRRLPARFESRGATWIPGLGRKVRQQRPDVVLLHNFLFPNSLQFAWLTKGSAPNFLLDNHASADNTPIRWPHRLLWGLFRKRWRNLLDHSRLTFGVSVSESRFIEQALGLEAEEVPTVLLGVDTDTFRPLSPEQRAAVREAWGVEEGHVVVAHGGKMSDRKSTGALLKAVSRLQHARRPLHLLLFGGFESSVLESQAAALPQCTQLGWLDRQHMAECLGASDIGCWPRHQSAVYQQALACGLPLVLGNEANNDLLVDEARGWRLPQADEQSIYHALDEVIASHQKGALLPMGTAARSFAEGLAWRTQAELLLHHACRT